MAADFFLNVGLFSVSPLAATGELWSNNAQEDRKGGKLLMRDELPEKQPYVAPRLTEIGRVEDLTQGEGYWSIDDFFTYGFHDIFGSPPDGGVGSG